MSKKAKGEKNFFMKHKVLTIIGALVIVGAIVGANGESTSTNSSNTANVIEEHSEITKEEQVTYTDIHMNTLMQDLDNNSAVAKGKYKGGYFNVTGTVYNIDSDGKYFDIRNDNEYSFIGLQIYLNKDQKEGLANISKGKEITVKVKITDVGEVLGYSADLQSW